jgi:hypothetical protein
MSSNDLLEVLEIPTDISSYSCCICGGGFNLPNDYDCSQMKCGRPIVLKRYETNKSNSYDMSMKSEKERLVEFIRATSVEVVDN